MVTILTGVVLYSPFNLSSIKISNHRMHIFHFKANGEIWDSFSLAQIDSYRQIKYSCGLCENRDPRVPFWFFSLIDKEKNPLIANLKVEILLSIMISSKSNGIVA